MKAGSPQLAMVVDDPAEVEREKARIAREKEEEIEDQRDLFMRFSAACRAVIRDLTADVVANELEAIWGELGRHVSSGVLKQTLAQGEVFNRNYFRFEWAIWFARQSEDCAELLAEIIGRGKPKKTAEQELADLKSVLHSEYPRQATRLIRKAETA
jgi:hypothetical protein